MVKVEENTSDNDRENSASGSIGEYFWSNRRSPIINAEQHYGPYELETRNINGATEMDYGNFDEDCANVGPHAGHSGFLTDDGNTST